MVLDLSRRSLAQMLVVASFVPVTGVQATPLAQPSDKPILVIRGKITNTNQDNRALLDRHMLEQLGMETIVTKTPWFKEVVKFEGVRLSRLMTYVGAYGDRVIVLALNDYSSEIPVSDFDNFGPILALKRDGNYMPISDKGPLFVIYPYDSSPDLQQDRFYMRSAWQVSEIDVK